MNKQDLTRVLHESTEGIHFTMDAQAVLRAKQTKGEVKMKRKLVPIVAAALLLALTMSIAVAESLGWGLTDFFRFTKEEAILKSQPEIVQTAIPQTVSGSERYTVTIVEAVYDGYASHVVAAIKPRDNSIQLIDEDTDADMPLCALNMPHMGFDAFDTNTDYPTIDEWAKEQGKTLKKVGYMLSDDALGTSALLEDGTYMLYETSNHGDSPDILPMELKVGFFAAEGGWNGNEDEITVSFTLEKTPPRWSKTVKPELEVEKYGIVVDEVTVTTTVMATYVNTRYHFTDPEKQKDCWFRPTDGNGNVMSEASSVASTGREGDNAYLCQTGSIPLDTLPQNLVLHVSDPMGSDDYALVTVSLDN